MTADFPEAIVYGGFARWLAQDERAGLPSDVDLLVPDSPTRLAHMVRWFEAHGFLVTRWGQPMGWDAAPAALNGACYFRAQRVRSDGALCVFDVCFEDSKFAYEGAASQATRIDGLSVLPTARPLSEA